jgi:hypothetical protein
MTATPQPSQPADDLRVPEGTFEKADQYECSAHGIVTEDGDCPACESPTAIDAGFAAMREHGNLVHDEEDHAGPCCIAVALAAAVPHLDAYARGRDAGLAEAFSGNDVKLIIEAARRTGRADAVAGAAGGWQALKDYLTETRAEAAELARANQFDLTIGAAFEAQVEILACTQAKMDELEQS